MQHHIRDPNRDDAHGRIYRMIFDGRPLLTPKKIDGQPIPALLALLKDPENQVREWAKLELDKRDSADVIAAVKQWTETLDRSDPAYEHHMMEALWLHQWHDVVDIDLLRRMLNSPEPRARAAATRVLCYWRDRVPDTLALLAERANDSNARVRLEAVRAASFFRSVEAADVALAALKHPTDYYIDYVVRESIRQLEPKWRDALAAGKPVAADNPAGFAYLMATVKTADLLKFPRNPTVLRSLLARGDVADAERHKALDELARELKTDRAAALLDTLDTMADADDKPNVLKILPQLPPRELKAVRPRLAELASKEKSADVRQYAWAGLATADESFDRVWSEASLISAAPYSPLVDVLAAVPLVYDPFIRARAYDKVLAQLAPNEPTTPQMRQAAIRAAVSINREHAKTFAALADLMERGEEIPVAASAMRSLPRNALGVDRCAKVAAALVAWARAVPADQRTSPQYLSTIQFTESLVTLLPSPRASEVLNDLRDLRVAVFVVGTVREQMRYDTPRLVVEAGKPFEITFENTDMMAHNLTIVVPGARKRVGEAAMKMKGDALDDRGRAYVPVSSDILAATKMLESGQREKLKVTAPDVEGDYEYVCTYPDHWQVMWGKLVVTNDIDAYLKSNPEKPTPGTKPVEKQAAHAH
jgi:azurin